MALVLPAERDLRRVIGDGESIPDGEVDGLSTDDLLELHRWLVLLRTYDERSVVYHRQGRIGTYAIFWGHEAMQAGRGTRLRAGAGSFPGTPSPRSGCWAGGGGGGGGCPRWSGGTGSPRAPGSPRGGCCGGPPPRRSSRGGAAIRPAGGTPPSSTSPRSACRSPPTCRTPQALPGARSCAASAPARSPTSATAPPRRAPFTRAPTSPP